MKLYIKNNTILNYKRIGELFDEYYKDIKSKFYIGKNDVIVIKENKKKYKLEIKVTKTRINLYIDELDLEPKKVDLRKFKFPKLPKKNEKTNN